MTYTAGVYQLHLTFGDGVAEQRLAFANGDDAARHAERLLTRLEVAGFRRQRRDKDHT